MVNVDLPFVYNTLIIDSSRCKIEGPWHALVPKHEDMEAICTMRLFKAKRPSPVNRAGQE